MAASSDPPARIFKTPHAGRQVSWQEHAESKRLISQCGDFQGLDQPGETGSPHSSGLSGKLTAVTGMKRSQDVERFIQQLWESI
jgi:hypothetical protein